MHTLCIWYGTVPTNIAVLSMHVRIICRYVAALVSVITTLYYVVKIIFHHRVWHFLRALSLHYACIRCLGIILTPRLPLC